MASSPFNWPFVLSLSDEYLLVMGYSNYFVQSSPFKQKYLYLFFSILEALASGFSVGTKIQGLSSLLLERVGWGDGPVGMSTCCVPGSKLKSPGSMQNKNNTTTTNCVWFSIPLTPVLAVVAGGSQELAGRWVSSSVRVLVLRELGEEW